MEQVPSADLREATLLRRLFPLYCGLTALITFGYALYDGYQVDGDAVSYMDIGDNLRAHHWAGIVNGYWHPMYPAFLSLGHMLMHATLANELRAYYLVNFVIFLMEMTAMVCFTDAVARLRSAMQPSTPPAYLLDRATLRYLGLALLTFASQRELSLGKVRPDALLQAFLLFALAALLMHLASGRARYAAWMGLALGCAYLTKSFAFVFALLCIVALAAFRWLWLKHSPVRVLPAAGIALISFGIVAGPYVTALSQQKGRLDFGDSGSLNYAWYVAGTEKMHLQPYQTSQFGSAEVHLKHPERELLHTPLILSYAEMPYGTYPDWFDTTYWNEQIKPKFRVKDDLPRLARNVVLVVRYLFNHPEALLLLGLFVLLGTRPAVAWRLTDRAANPFWIVPLALGVSIWAIYAIVNTEERYVTVAYLAIILTVFATLRVPRAENRSSEPSRTAAYYVAAATAVVFLFAIVAMGESLRTVLEDRRQLAIFASPGGWYSPAMVRAADGLHALGIKPGDNVACIGFKACLDDQYWARLAGVRILTEVYDPDAPVPVFLGSLANRGQVIDIVRGQGAKAIVGDFGTARTSDLDPAFQNWHQLAGTTFYALPLTSGH